MERFTPYDISSLPLLHQLTIANTKNIMVYSRSRLIILIICNIVFLGYDLGVHLVIAQNENDFDGCTESDGDDICQGGENKQQQQQRKPLKESKLCSSYTIQHENQVVDLSTLEHFYQQGISAQTYKSNTQVKSSVCEGVDSDDSIQSTYNVAYWSFWRSSYNVVPKMVVTANIYSCGDPNVNSISTSAITSALNEEDIDGVITMEVWQPRPDGTYSSLRPGIEEGDCRASVPMQQNHMNTNNNNEFSNILGYVQFTTSTPGSPGLLNGLIPHGSRDYPPYSKGNIQMHVNLDGYYPWLGQLSMNELDGILKNKEHQGSVGRRPHDTKNVNDDSGSGSGGGIEIQSVTQVSESLIKVEIDIFIEQRKTEEMTTSSQDSSDIFCSSSSRGLFNWIASSFFKEPIAICFPSLLDFFQL